MTCTCLCCLDGATCVRELVLDRRDTADAARVNAIVGQWAGDRVVHPSPSQESRRDRTKPDPMVAVICRSCRRPFSMHDYLATFMHDHNFTAQCEVCR